MSVTIVLDNELKKEPPIDSTKARLLSDVYQDIESTSDSSDGPGKLLLTSTNNPIFHKGPTKNALINAVLEAYNKHKRLILTPDDILNSIAITVSNHINENAEVLRKLFVDHEDTKNLVVINKTEPGIFDWDDLISQMNDKLRANIKTEYPLGADFSTTTIASQTANNMITMGVFDSAYWRFCITNT